MKKHYKSFVLLLCPMSALAAGPTVLTYSLIGNALLLISVAVFVILFLKQKNKHNQYRAKAISKINDLKITDERVWLSSLNSISTAIFDVDGTLLNSNKVFKQTFENLYLKTKGVDDFIETYFYKDKSLNNSKRVYRFKNDIKNEYFINVSLNKKTKKRICEIFKFDLQELVELGLSRKFEIDNESVNALDVLEEIIASRLSFATFAHNTIPKVESASGLILFTNEFIASQLFRNIYTAINSILEFKKISSQLSINLSRDNEDFIVSATFDGHHLLDEDFNESVMLADGESTLLSLIRKIEETTDSIKIRSTIKNVEDGSKKFFEFKICIADLNNVQWTSKNFKRENEILL